MRILFGACVIFALCFIGGCSRFPRDRESNQDYEAVKKIPIECEAPAQAEMRPWGKVGQSYGCYIRTGQFVAAEDGYVRLRGQFNEGKEAGIWRWYDKQGNVIKEVDYSAAESN